MAEKGTDKEKETKEEAALDPKYLKGLSYRNAEERDVVEDGIKKKKKFPRVQPLTLDRVLSWREDGKEIVIVAMDGRKYRVKK